MTEALGKALRSRFGADYDVITENDPRAAVARLQQLAADGIDVVLVIADLTMPEIGGLELLSHVTRLHRDATRILLLSWTETGVSTPVTQAMGLGQIDVTFGKPWGHPEARLYPMVSEVLGQYSREHGGELEIITVVGEQWSPRSHELRDLLTRNHLPFGFYASDSAAGRDVLERLHLSADRLPVIVFYDGRYLVEPSNDEIAAILGARLKAGSDLYDLVIIGAGPAGLAAAVYGASEGLKTALIEREAIGGQAGASSMIRNYLGFPRGIAGSGLMSRAFEQASWFGTETVLLRQVTALREEGDERILSISDGSEVRARAVVIATGVTYRRLAAPGVEALAGVGVFYGASLSEAKAMKGEHVFVVGGANSAGQAALYLAREAARVTVLVRDGSIADDMSAYLVREIETTPNIEVLTETEVVEVKGTHRIQSVAFRNRKDGRLEEVPCCGLFVLIGAEPGTDWLAGVVERDAQGYIVTEPNTAETSMPGVFVAGDVRAGSVKRVSAAVGAGAVAVTQVHQYFNRRREEKSLSGLKYGAL